MGDLKIILAPPLHRDGEGLCGLFPCLFLGGSMDFLIHSRIILQPGGFMNVLIGGNFSRLLDGIICVQEYLWVGFRVIRPIIFYGIQNHNERD